MSHSGAIVLKRVSTWRWFKRVAGIVLVFYVLVSIMGCALQDKMFFPGAATQGTPGAMVREKPTTELVRLQLPDGTPIVARFDMATGVARERAPTVLLLYGNGQCAQTSGGVVYLLQQLGCNVLTPDYAGYGMSGGKPSEQSLYDTANAAWAHLKQRPGIDHDRLYILGWSLGGAVAIDLASRENPRGLITISTFTTARAMASQLMPVVPMGMLLRHKFASIDKIEHVKCPLLLIHGQRDSIVPSTMAEALAERARSPKQLLILPESDHNDIFDIDWNTISSAIGTFITTH